MSASASPLTRKQEWYRANAEKARADSRAFHQRKQPHVSVDELLRLRLPENRSEALNYGAEKKQQVCLNCGASFDGNFSRHPSACPAKKQSSDAYREDWGYAKSNSLTSPDWHERKSHTLKNSTKFETAQRANRESTLAAFAKRRAEVTEAKKCGSPFRRAPLRAEVVARRTGRRLSSRPDKQRVPDIKIVKILALDLPLGQAARRAHLSLTAFYNRALKLGWDPKAVKARRSLVNRYIFDLRRWLWGQQQIPTIEAILSRHAEGLRKGIGLHREFSVFVPHLEAELQKRPKTIQELAERKKVGTTKLILANSVIALASRVFKRSRSSDRHQRWGPIQTPREEKKDFFIGNEVEKALPKITQLCSEVSKFKKRDRTNVNRLTALLDGKDYSQKEIVAVAHAPGTPLKAARWFVSTDTSLEYDTVAEYHKRFRRSVPSSK